LENINLVKIRPFWKTRSSINDPLSFFEEIDKKGEFCHYKGFLSFTYVGNPKLVKQVLDKTGTNYNKENPLYDRFRFILGQGMLTSEGKNWRDQKKSFSPFFSKNNISKFLPIIFRNMSQTLDIWNKYAEKEVALNLSEEFFNLTLKIIGEIILSDDLKEHLLEIRKITKVFNEYVASPPIPIFSSSKIPTPLNLKVKKARDGFIDILKKIIEKRMSTKQKREDLLQIILDKNPDKITPLILDQILSLIIAGHETTSNALVWTFFHLSKNTSEKDKIQKLLDREIKGLFPSFKELELLDYLRQIINESLRLSPPVWLITRKSIKENILGGHKIKPGQMIVFSPYFIHRNEKYWKNAADFRPDRFDKNKKIEKDAFLPFGLGPHTCIGSNLSMMQMSLFLSVLLKSFDWSCIGSFPKPFLSFTMGVKDGPMVILKKRKRVKSVFPEKITI
tara:strand:- start:10713 stop:12059 length:1347 start_codon:yes stop_codon:yes gene_type:complete